MSSPDGVLQGFVDYYGPDRVAGWAWNASEPSRAVEVEARVRDHSLGATRADRFRADLVIPGTRSGYQAFEVVFPEPISNEWVSELQVRIKPTDVALPFSKRRDFVDGAPPTTVFDRLAIPRFESPFLEAIIE